MRIQGCPAAVSRNESRHTALGFSWEAAAGRAGGRASAASPASPKTCRRTGHTRARWSAASREGEQARVRGAHPAVRHPRHRTVRSRHPEDVVPELSTTTTSTTGFATRFRATVLGYPRIGPHRELKKALEKFWAGDISIDGLTAVGRGLRSADRALLLAAGLDSIPVNTFSYYDHVLDTAVLLGAIPERFTALPDGLDRYFAMARGAGDCAPLEMTKWFDTNYHYLVPEISADTAFSLHPDAVLADLAEAVADGHPGPAGDSRPGEFPAVGQTGNRSGRARTRSTGWTNSCRCTATCSRCWRTAARSGCNWTNRRWSPTGSPAEIEAARRAYAALAARRPPPGDHGRVVLRRPRGRGTGPGRHRHRGVGSRPRRRVGRRS